LETIPSLRDRFTLPPRSNNDNNRAYSKEFLELYNISPFPFPFLNPPLSSFLSPLFFTIGPLYPDRVSGEHSPSGSWGKDQTEIEFGAIKLGHLVATILPIFFENRSNVSLLDCAHSASWTAQNWQWTVTCGQNTPAFIMSYRRKLTATATSCRRNSVGPNRRSAAVAVPSSSSRRRSCTTHAAAPASVRGRSAAAESAP